MKYRLVRGSEVDDFQRCRKRWKWRWVDKLKPKKPNGKLFFGSLFHKFTERYYESLSYTESGLDPAVYAKSSMQSMFDQTDTSRMEQTEIDELWDLAYKVTSNYVAMWGEKDRGMRVIATEFTFAIPLANGIAYTGTIDKLYLDEEARLWFKDYKTTTAIEKYVKKAKMDRQIRRYFWALQQLARGEGYILERKLVPIQQIQDEIQYNVMDVWTPAGDWIYRNVGALPEPHGFIYDVVLKDYPEPPEPLKKGGLSKNKAQRTTYAMYLQAIRDNNLLVNGYSSEHGLDVPEEYWEILDHLKNQEDEYGNKFFKRVKVYCHPGEIENAIQEFYAAACDMVGLRAKLEEVSEYIKMPHDPIYRNVTDDCDWDCSYQGMCIASMDGSDVSGLLEMFYEHYEEGELGQEWLEI